MKGLALSGGMCSYRDVRSVVGSIGLSSSAIAAHENFHKYVRIYIELKIIRGLIG
jgi:hypothetical protein